MKQNLITLLLLLALLIDGTAGCKALNALEDAAQEPATEASAPVLDAAPTGVQPAPATMSRAQAKRYYEAQLAAQQPRVPAKQKNSNNVTNTYEQKISNVSIGIIVLIVVVVAVLSFGVGALYIGNKFRPRF